MYRARLRKRYGEQELGNIYRAPHIHKNFRDHLIRVQVTIAVAQWLGDLDSVADLSAGDATIINAINSKKKYIGDFAPGYEIVGPIEKTINEIPEVDLFILSETIEHLDDPDFVLGLINQKAQHILLTTPDGEIGNRNPEHYWGWDTECIKSMLLASGFEPMVLTSVRLKDYGYLYDYQIWLAKKTNVVLPSQSRGGR